MWALRLRWGAGGSAQEAGGAGGQLAETRGRRHLEAQEVSGLLHTRDAGEPRVRAERHRAGHECVPQHRRAGCVESRPRAHCARLDIRPQRRLADRSEDECHVLGGGGGAVRESHLDAAVLADCRQTGPRWFLG